MMSVVTAPIQATYFGKLPSRGDFVKGAAHPQLLSQLDRWLSHAMDLLATDPAWKSLYDSAAPLDFAFIGSRRRLAIVGHLVASHDASERRFPFLAAALVELSDPLPLLMHGPIHLSRLWSRLAREVHSARHTADATDVLRALGEPALDTDFDDTLPTLPLSGFLASYTVGDLQSLLNGAGHRVDVRRMLIALGLLLQPLLAGTQATIERGISLPLPSGLPGRNLVAACWTGLIAGFLQRGDFELQLLIGAVDGCPRLLLGLNGASPHTILGLLAPDLERNRNIAIDDPDWVDAHVRGDYGLAKLSSYLEQPSLSLKVAVDTFREVFLGQ